MEYTVNGVTVELEVSGVPTSGADRVMLCEDDDLTDGLAWHPSGYVVSRFLDGPLRSSLRSGLETLIRRVTESVSGRSLDRFSLVRYHHLCADDASHRAVVSDLQALSPIENFPVDYRELDACVSEVVGVAVSCNVQGREAAGRFFIRVVRPGRFTDNNPPHRDVWLPRLRDAINLYVPIAGSNSLSSLSLVPGSHLWPDSEICRTAEGASIGGVNYTVPAVLGCVRGLRMVRPPVDDDQMLLFSPYLIHGGAVNLNADMTRMSLEMRFWRR